MRLKSYMAGIHGLCLLAALSWVAVMLGCSIGVKELPAILFFGQFPLFVLDALCVLLILVLGRIFKLENSQISPSVLWVTMVPGLISLALIVIAVWPIGSLWVLLPFLYLCLMVSVLVCALQSYTRRLHALAFWWACVFLGNGLVFIMSGLLWRNDVVIF